jgi:hypothetical protein
MKNIVVLVVIALAGLVAYNYFTTGEVKLIPTPSRSGEDIEVERLEKQFRQAQSRFLEGSRGASIGGIDTPADVVGAMREVERIEEELIALKARLTSEAAKTKAAQVLSDIGTFKQANR